MRIIGRKLQSIDLEEFLSRPLFARPSTASPSGPRDSPVWFLWEDGYVWIIGSDRENSFQNRVKEEPRCALGIVDFDIERGIVLRALYAGNGGR